MTDPAGSGVVTRLVGVYNANGSLKGELTYFFKSRLGLLHCTLCDITHGPLREKQSWRDARGSLPVPFVTYHLDDVPASVRGTSTSTAPYIVAETDQGTKEILSAKEIEQCEGSPEKLILSVRAAVDRLGLRW